MNPSKPPPFRQGKGHDKLNRALEARVSEILGDGTIQVRRVGDKVIIGLSVAQLLPKIPKPRQAMRFGKATAAWSSGNTINLTPCALDGTTTGEDARDVYLYLPTSHTPVGVLIAQNDVLAFWPFMDGTTPKGVLVSVPLDTSTSCP